MMKKQTIMMLITILLMTVCVFAQAETFAMDASHPQVRLASEVMGTYCGDELEKDILRIDVYDDAVQTLMDTVYAVVDITQRGAVYMHMEDVNFDGHKDIVLLTTLGASNARFQFFVWNPQTLHFVLAGEPVWNYTLYPEKGLVLSSGSNGWAGILHQDDVFGWEEGVLVRLRSSVWDTLTETDYEGEGERFTVSTVYDSTRIVEAYSDHMTGETQTYTGEAQRYLSDVDFCVARFAAQEAFLLK